MCLFSSLTPQCTPLLCILIGASLSEPHTSESNSGFFIYIYIYIYLPYVFRKCKLNSFNPKHCAAETPEERERRLQPLLKCITRRILYHIETVNYHSILCKIILVQHVNYHASSVQTCTQQELCQVEEHQHQLARQCSPNIIGI